jgi:uncharacterized protein YgiM (DUF1202 family)
VAFAQGGSAPKTLPETLPNTTISPATAEISASGTAAPPTHHKTPHATAKKSASWSGPVEPVTAMLKLKEDSWAYANPTSSSSHLERVTAGKFVNITGTTHYFARVKLKSGAVGYVPLSAVELARPTDKVFKLTKDTPVLSEPNHYGKKVAEVHNGHDVHIVGTSLNYMKIKMKDGLEGYIPMGALE